MKNKPAPREAVTLLCEQLEKHGLKLHPTHAHDLIAMLEGYTDWNALASHTGQNNALYPVTLIYLTGFAEKGYWWTKAERAPWLLGAQGQDFDGPYETEEIAHAKAAKVHPQGMVLGYRPEAQAAEVWEAVSVFARLRTFIPLSPKISKIIQNPGCEERRAMNDAFAFSPSYAQSNGRVTSVSSRSALTFIKMEPLIKKAVFEFNARIEVSKPVGVPLKTVMDKMSYLSKLPDTLDEYETQLVSWQ